MADECTCFWLPPEQWNTSYYGIAEPGSQMEPNPECPEHFPRCVMTEKNRVTMHLGDAVTVEMDMCQETGCVLAAGHPPNKHAQRRVSMLACPHNVPNFGPECPICDIASVQLSGKLRYEISGDPRPREPRSEMVDTVEQLDRLSEGAVIREVREHVTWVKAEGSWRCIRGFVPGTNQPLLPAVIIGNL
jgi:hypothetical protein